MSDTKKRANQIDPTSNNSKNGNGASGKAIPDGKFRVGVQNGKNGHADGASHTTAPLPVQGGATGHNGNGHNGNGNGNGHGAVRVAEVRPIKVRLGHTERLVADSNGHNGNGHNGNGHNGNGNGHSNGHSNGNGNGHNGNGTKAITESLVVASTNTKRTTTSHLRESDLRGMRFRLGYEPPVLVPTSSRRRSVHRRELPYFMMRHRAMRAGARAGYTRGKLAAARYGKGGALAAVAKLSIASWLFLMLLFLSTMGIGVAGAAMYIGQLPPVDPTHLQADILKYGVSVQTSQIFDRNKNPLYEVVDEQTGRREELPLNKISPLVISATVAAEDGNFYTNAGVDPVAIVRAVIINSSGDGTSGASTIAQQLVRQIILSPEERTERTLNRKLKEMVLAVELTQTYSKDDIMQMFLNQNYYGHRAYGISAAAYTYFHKSATELTLAEASLLAGLPQAPTEYDPYVNIDFAKKRRAYVLDQMAKYGMITDQQAEEAKAQDVALAPNRPDAIQAPHFVYYVKNYLEKMYGADALEQGLKVYTTLDLNVQNAAQQVAKDRIDELRKQKATNASIVIMKPGTGEILGMVGSVDYNDTSIDGQVNVAIAERQPGSSFKPITYVTAFKKGWTPGTVLLDTLTSFPNPGQKPYIPYNYDKKDHGWVTVRESLGNSLNIPAVKALQFAGIQDTIDTAHDMGIHGLNRGTGWYGLSLTLGGGEVTLLDMTNAYSTFANGGAEVDANPILRIEDSLGRTIYQLDQNAPRKQVLDPRINYMITDILSDNKARALEFGLNSPLKLSFPAAAKTGTTNDNRDSWTLGYTPDLTVGVWVGNSNNAEMQAVTGAIGAAVIWHNMMEKFYSTPEFVDLIRHPDGKIQRDFVQPPGLIKTSACSAKGDVYDLFLKSSPPKGCTTYRDKNQQLHSAPGGGNSNSNRPGQSTPVSRPNARPTPIPGIGPPAFNNP